MIDLQGWEQKRAGWILSETLRKLNLTHAQARRVVIHVLAAVTRELPEDDIGARIWVAGTASYAMEAIFHDELDAAIAKRVSHSPGPVQATIFDTANSAPMPSRHVHPKGIPETVFTVIETKACTMHGPDEPEHDMYMIKGNAEMPYWECSRTTVTVEAAADEQ